MRVEFEIKAAKEVYILAQRVELTT